MAWVRPKHPKTKVEVDPTESLLPVLEYFSYRPSVPNPNGKELKRIPRKPLLRYDSYRPKPQKRHYKEPELHEKPDSRHQRAEHHPDQSITKG